VLRSHSGGLPYRDKVVGVFWDLTSKISTLIAHMVSQSAALSK
jgi:hypothetical protein